MAMLSEASRDIANQQIEAERRRAESERFARMVQSIDRLLFQLEELNLHGVDRVPADLRDRAASILDRLPEASTEEERESLRLKYRVGPLMDVLFNAQELLFRMRDPDRGVDDEEGLGA